MRDLMNNIDLKLGNAPVAARTDNTPIVSAILDMQGCDAAVYAILIGANTDSDATFAVEVTHGDAVNSESAPTTITDSAAVPDNMLIGTEALAGFTAANDDNKVRKIGYRGPKRWVRVTVTPSGNDSGNIFLAGLWIKGVLHQRPSANPPA